MHHGRLRTVFQLFSREGFRSPHLYVGCVLCRLRPGTPFAKETLLGIRPTWPTGPAADSRCPLSPAPGIDLLWICAGTRNPWPPLFFSSLSGGSQAEKSNKIRRNTWGQSWPFDGSIGRAREIFRSSVVPKSDVCVANHVCSSVAVNETRMQSHYENASARSSSAAAALETSWGEKEKKRSRLAPTPRRQS